jgi:hypothetical protein
MTELIDWLKNIGCEGLDGLDIAETSEGHGMGCFARKRFNIGDVLFKIPRAAMISVGNVSHSPVCAAVIKTINGNANFESLLTIELLIWIFICSERFGVTGSCTSNDNATFRPYLESLSEQSPDILSWPPHLRDAFVGTNLEASIALAESRMEDIERLFVAVRDALGENAANIFPRNVYNRRNISWARGHYLSRRYPGAFAQGESILPRHLEGFNQEKGLEELGTFIPLLDILNHKTIEEDREWLDLSVNETDLIVRTNFCIEKGSELFSNYGSSKSNEMLLYAYGFAVEGNPYDTVALRLMAGRTAAPVPVAVSEEAPGAGAGTGGTTITTTTAVTTAVGQVGYFYAGLGGMKGVPAVSSH